MSQMRVTIHRVVLNGVAPDQRQALVDGLRQELVRILADPATRSALKPREMPALRLAPTMLIPGRAGATRLGAELARGIGRGLAR
jgi:hypothetical protein